LSINAYYYLFSSDWLVSRYTRKNVRESADVTLTETSLCDVSKINGHELGYALFHHRDPINYIRAGDGPFIMRYDDKLRLFRKFANDVIELIDIGVIQRCIDLVENTKWGWL